MRLGELLQGASRGGTDTDDTLRARIEEAGVEVGPGNVKFQYSRLLAKTLVTNPPSKIEETTGEVIVSVADLAHCQMAVEIIVAWWLLPLLEPGVGIPLEKRTQSTNGAGGMALNELEKNSQSLWGVVCVLLKLLKMPFLSGIVREGHLIDIMSALLQLGYFDQAERDEALAKNARALLPSILENQFNVDTVMEGLLIFVNPSAPKWLRSAAGSMLSQCLLWPNAVLALLTMMLEDKPGNRSQSEGLLDKTAVLITSVPRSHAHDSAGFYRVILAQLLQSLRSSSETVRLCVAICVERVLRQDPESALEAFFKPLFNVPFDDETAVDRFVEDLSLLIVPCGAGRTGDSFWTCMIPSAGRLVLLIGCAVCGSASRLSKPVGNLLDSMIRIPARDVQRRQLLNGMILDASIPETNDFVFHLGPSGGAVKLAQAAERDWERECAIVSQWALKSSPDGLMGDVFAQAMETIASAQGVSTRYLIMLQLASELLLQPKLLQDAIQILGLVKSLLSVQSVDEQVAALLLAVLAEMLPKLRLEKHQEPLVTDLLPLLENLGAQQKDLFPQCVALVDQIRALPKVAISTTATSSANGSPTNAEDAFNQALDSLTDPLLPVRAHALLTLRKLVLQRDAHTLTNFSCVVEIFQKQMSSFDSAVYIGAIHGLAALGDVAPNETIPVLIEDFHNASLMIEARLKVGEATVAIAQRSGEMLPVYAPSLMDCFLRGVVDSVADIRASSLANIGSMCDILNWALHPYIREIIYAVNRILETEKDFVVRRSAAMVLEVLVNGLGPKLYSMAQGQTSELFARLEIIAKDLSEDEIVRKHAALALEDFES